MNGKQGQGNQGSGRKDEGSGYTLDKNKIQNWIKNGIDTAAIDDYDRLGQKLAKEGLTSTQFRAIFGSVRKIELFGIKDQLTEFLLLKPKIAYTFKRHGDKMKTFYEFFVCSFEAVVGPKEELEKRFKNFADSLEAVLAFHKYHGGN
jgi:CRISPR-associated protein Csm2